MMSLFTLTVLFVTLRLTGAITWSWWLVLSPFYGMVLCFGMLVVCRQRDTLLPRRGGRR